MDNHSPNEIESRAEMSSQSTLNMDHPPLDEMENCADIPRQKVLNLDLSSQNPVLNLSNSVINRSSNRIRRTPVTRNNDFFMVTQSPRSGNLNTTRRSSAKCDLKHSELNSQSFIRNKYKNCSSGHSSFHIYHQNIRGLQGKTNELISSLYPGLPHVLCLSEHHLNYNELCRTYIEHYNFSAAFCRKDFKLGGSCIFMREGLKFLDVNLSAFCKEKDPEVCAVKLPFPQGNICVLAIYRAPSGNFAYFLKGLDAILKSLYEAKLKLMICGDVNINYLVNSNKKQLDDLLSSFNLFSTVDFLTRIQSNSASAIDNIFIDLHSCGDYIIRPHVIGLSDHDAQIVYINNIGLQNCHKHSYFVRKFNKASRNEFLTQLSYEMWDNVFVEQDIDTIFNSFLNTYLRIFNSSFLKKLVMNNMKQNPWITRGIMTSCQYKRKLYLLIKTNDPNLKSYFKIYSKILSNVIKAAKNLYYNGLILNSNNKTKSTWNIIKTMTGKSINNSEVQILNTEGKLTDNHQKIADSLNEYFLTSR
jgi:exonuclease III